MGAIDSFNPMVFKTANSLRSAVKVEKTRTGFSARPSGTQTYSG